VEEEEGRGRKPVRIILHWVEKTLLVDFLKTPLSR
jgi:hypothetical protein